MKARVLATAGIDDHSESRQVVVESPNGPVPLTALQLRALGTPRSMLSGDAAHAWPEFERGAVIISDPLACRLQLRLGDELPLSTASGVRAIRDRWDLSGVWE